MAFDHKTPLGRGLAPGRRRLSMPVVHVSFGTEEFRQSLTLLRASAERYGIHDVRFYSPDHGVIQRLQRDHPRVMAAPRGAGYWLWKPHVIADTLSNVADGTVVAYTDAAIVYAADPSPVLAATIVAPVVTFLNPARNAYQARYTKRDCFVLLEADRPAEWRRWQLDASTILFRAGEKSRSFVAKWAAACENEHVLTDAPNVCGLPNLDGFVDHRHDQSVLTILAARHRFRPLRPAKWSPSGSNSDYSIFYHHRQRTPIDDEAFDGRLAALRLGLWPRRQQAAVVSGEIGRADTRSDG